MTRRCVDLLRWNASGNDFHRVPILPLHTVAKLQFEFALHKRPPHRLSNLVLASVCPFLSHQNFLCVLDLDIQVGLPRPSLTTSDPDQGKPSTFNAASSYLVGILKRLLRNARPESRCEPSPSPALTPGLERDEPELTVSRPIGGSLGREPNSRARFIACFSSRVSGMALRFGALEEDDGVGAVAVMLV